MNDKEKILVAKSIQIPDAVKHLSEAEFSVFSQWGDDGIIQFLIKALDIKNKFFVEFGVEDYRESNTRYLMMNNNWSGFVMDGDPKNIEKIRSADYFWKYDLLAQAAFVTRENIYQLLAANTPVDSIGLLHIDIDGMDYWIWKELSYKISPQILIVEYNSLFGSERKITVPHAEDFHRLKAHYSGLYAGASLPAFYNLNQSLDYAFVGTNSAGNNAYFVKKDLLNSKVNEITLKEGFTESRFREARDKKGKLTFTRAGDRQALIRGLPVVNTETGLTEQF